MALGPCNIVAVVGAGLVGSSWSIIFALAGKRVQVYDADLSSRARVLDHVHNNLSQMQAAGLASNIDEALRNITIMDSLEAAVANADYIQESVFERVEIKSEISKKIGNAMRPDAVIGSSSSGIPASEFTADATNRNRFLIAHPVNPPHLVPLVELVPAPWTDPEILPWLRGVMESIGQTPIVVNREIEGFILNRLQGALLNEAFALFEEGYVSVADLDSTMSAGLGLRWAFMGPFETIDLNAFGGIDDYARRLGPLYHSIAKSRHTPRPWSEELVEKLCKQRRDILPQKELGRRRDWRDQRLMKLVAYLRAQTHDI